MEKETGSGLLELPSVSQGRALVGELSNTVVAGQSELRQWRSVQAANREMLRLLQATQQDPQQLVVAPAPLLESQPTLRQLKQGLVEAQLRASVLAGTVTEGHPQLVVARQAEQDIKRVIFQEVAAAIRGVEAEIQLANGRIQAAEEQLATENSRVKRSGAMRAEYSNLVDQVEHHRTELDLAKQYLAESRADQAFSQSSSVIDRVNAPEESSTPVGPSRATIALLGLVGGLATGFGVLYLTVPPRAPAVRAGRASPAQGCGRRTVLSGGRLSGRSLAAGVVAAAVSERGSRPQTALRTDFVCNNFMIELVVITWAVGLVWGVRFIGRRAGTGGQALVVKTAAHRLSPIYQASPAAK